MKDLTPAELQFVIGLVESVQISGNADQVRAVLQLRDSVLRKLVSPEPKQSPPAKQTAPTPPLTSK